MLIFYNGIGHLKRNEVIESNDSIIIYEDCDIFS